MKPGALLVLYCMGSAILLGACYLFALLFGWLPPDWIDLGAHSRSPLLPIAVVYLTVVLAFAVKSGVTAGDFRGVADKRLKFVDLVLVTCGMLVLIGAGCLLHLLLTWLPDDLEIGVRRLLLVLVGLATLALGLAMDGYKAAKSLVEGWRRWREP
jgi:hypothetical protein